MSGTSAKNAPMAALWRNNKMALEIQSKGLEPRWQRQLGLKPGDPAIAKLESITKFLESLKLSILDFPVEQRGDILEKDHLAKQGGPTVKPDFKYGKDYFFGAYKGRPQGVEQNAVTAQYQGRQGVELWRVMKSVAFATPDQKFAIAHVRGDREVDTAGLARRLQVEEADLTAADVSSLGVERGTVNPFISGFQPWIPDSDPRVRHWFDSDLVEGKNYPGSDMVITSSGDPRFFVGFDIRRFLKAIYRVKASDATFNISKEKPNSPERIVARRPVTVIGGDSTKDTASFQIQIAASITDTLKAHEVYFGDRSLPPLDSKSDPGLAGSIDTDLYAEELQTHVAEIVQKLKRPAVQGGPLPIVTFSSMAMHGIGGPILRDMEGVEYVGPKEALIPILDELAKQDVKIAHTMLLGLPSVYDSERSAFAGEISVNALPINDNVERQLLSFVQECKTGRANSETFYTKIVGAVLRQITKGQIDALKDKNVAIILGASELESFANTFHAVPEPYAIIKSNDPKIIAEKIARNPDRIRLILIQPGQAVADMIARKTVGLET